MSSFILFALSIVISTGIIVTFRYLDRNNRSFEKIHKLAKNLKQDFNQYVSDKYNHLLTLDDQIKGSYGKGKGLLEQMSKNVEAMEKRYSFFSKNKDLEKVNQFFQRVALLEEQMKHFAEQFMEMKKNRDFSKNTKKMLKDAASEMKQIKNNYNTLKNDLENTRHELISDVNTSHSQFKDEMLKAKNELSHFSEDQQRKFQISSEEIKDDLKKIEHNSARLKADFLGKVEEHFTKLEKHNTDKVADIRNDMKKVELELQKGLERKLNDYSNYIIKLEERGQGFQEEILTKIESDKEKYILDLRQEYNFIQEKMAELNEKIKSDARNNMINTFNEYENNYLVIYDKLKNMNEESEQKIAKYELFLDDTTGNFEKFRNDINAELKHKKEDFDLHIENIDDLAKKMELEALESIKTNLIETRRICDEKIAAFKDNVDLKISNCQTEMSGQYDQSARALSQLFEDIKHKKDEVDQFKEHLTHIMSLLEQKQEMMNQDFSENFLQLNQQLNQQVEGMQKTYSDVYGQIREKIDQNSSNLQEYIEKEKQDQIDSINQTLLQISHEADGKTNQMQDKFDVKYTEVEKKLTAVESDLVERAQVLQSNMQNKSRQIEEDINEKQQQVFQMVHQKIDVYKNDLLKHRNDLDQQLEYFKNHYSHIIDDIQLKVEESNHSLTLLGSETDEKIKLFKQNILNTKQSLLDMNDSMEKQLIEKMGQIDNKFETKMDMFNEKFKIHINEIYDRTNDVEDNFVKKIDQLETQFNRKVEELTHKNFENIDQFKDELAGLHKQYEEICDKIDREIEIKVDHSKEMLTDQYRILEAETIKKINGYKNDLLKIRETMQQLDEKFLQRYTVKVKELDQQLDGKMEEVNQTYQEHIDLLKDKMTFIEAEFNQRTDQMILDNSQKLNQSVVKYEALASQINDIKAHLEGEIREKIEQGKEGINSILMEQLENSKVYYSETEKDLMEKLADFKKEYIKIQQNMKQIDDRFTARFLDHAGLLDKRIAEIETEIKRFEKSSGMFEKVNHIKDRFNADLKNMKTQIDEIKKVRLEVVEIEKKMVKIDRTAEETNQKYLDILSNRRKIDNVESMIDNLKEISQDALDNIDFVKSAKMIITNLENRIKIVTEQCSQIESTMEKVEKEESEIKNTISTLTAVKGNAENLEMKYNLLTKKMSNLEFKKNTFEKSFKNFEKDASLITKSEAKVMEVIEKFNQMDSLIEDLEVRTDSINKIREWLVKAETQIENMNFESDRKIKLLESLINKTGDSPIVKEKMKDENSKKETVLQLQAQGWTVDDIAKTLNLSMGEVEFILDLELNTKKH